MYNTLIAAAAAVAVYALIALTLQPVAAIFPAVLLFGVVFYLLTRRTGKAVDAGLAEVMELLQEQKLDEAIARIESVKDQWSRWQPLLARQLDAQTGMIHYLQLHWDEALPLLDRGKWRNWTAHTCIGAIHYRQDRKDEAWESFAKAAKASKKEAMVYVVWATLLSREGKREEALEALSEGLKAVPESELLKRVQGAIANKKRLETRTYPQTWYQFFPEDLVRQQQQLRRQRTGPMPGHGFRGPKVSRKARRGR